MHPHYIIDGYNIIHLVPRLRDAMGKSLEHARNILLSLLQSYRSGHAIQCTVVFDGAQICPAATTGPAQAWLRVIYSKPPEKADPVIKKLIRDAGDKRSLVLVSADNDLLFYARQNGAQTLSPDEFYSRIFKPPLQDSLDQKYNDDVSHSQVDEWLKIFGEGES